jgi:hypothetical protein
MIELADAIVFAPAASTGSRTLGCPVANGVAPCNHLCGGGWPGTKISHEQMLKALETGRLTPESLGCGPLQDQARYWYLAHANN